MILAVQTVFYPHYSETDLVNMVVEKNYGVRTGLKEEETASIE